jgi:hypothetical protein
VAANRRDPQAGRIRPALVAGFFIALQGFGLRHRRPRRTPPGGETIQSEVVDRIEVL